MNYKWDGKFQAYIDAIAPEERLKCNNKLNATEIKKWFVALQYKKPPGKTSLKKLTKMYNDKMEELEVI